MLLDDGAECLDGEWPRWVRRDYGRRWFLVGAAGDIHIELDSCEYRDQQLDAQCEAPPCNWVEPPPDVFWDGKRTWTDDELLLELAVGEMERLCKVDGQ